MKIVRKNNWKIEMIINQVTCFNNMLSRVLGTNVNVITLNKTQVRAIMNRLSCNR